MALGVVNEQHFWSALCGELGWAASWRTSASRSDAGAAASCSGPSATSVARRDRDELVASLAAAGVPVAPVLDRAEMVARAPFPTFPIRLPLPDSARAVPALDQHRGEGFRTRA